MDIEWWNNGPIADVNKNPAVTLCALSPSEDTGDIKTYFRTMKPEGYEQIPEKVLKKLGLTLHNVKDTLPEEIVFTNLFVAYKDIERFVVWNRKTYDLLMTKVKAFGINVNPHKVVVVQELIDDLSDVGIISFQRALEIAGISYDTKLLHQPRFDVTYLKELYDALLKEYSIVTGGMAKAGSKKGATKVLHWKDAEKLEERKPEYVHWENNEHIISENIVAMCEELGLHGEILGDGILLVKFNAGVWKIHYEGDKVLGIRCATHKAIRQADGDLDGIMEPKEVPKESLGQLLNYMRERNEVSKRTFAKKRWEMLLDKATPTIM